MADISKIKVGETSYNVKDDDARENVKVLKQKVTMPVVFGRAIPINTAREGTRYLMTDGMIKLRGLIDEQAQLAQSCDWWTVEEQDGTFTASLGGFGGKAKIVTIPSSLSIYDFICDPQYRNQFISSGEYYSGETASPNFRFVNGHRECIKPLIWSIVKIDGEYLGIKYSGHCLFLPNKGDEDVTVFKLFKRRRKRSIHDSKPITVMKTTAYVYDTAGANFCNKIIRSFGRKDFKIAALVCRRGRKYTSIYKESFISFVIHLYRENLVFTYKI